MVHSGVVQMRVRDARARARESESARGHVAENARKQGTYVPQTERVVTAGVRQV